LKKRELTEKEQESLKTFQSFKIIYPNYYTWIKAGAIVAIAIPIVIWLIYLIGDYLIGIPTDIQAGEVLNFYGTFLTFIGTVALSALAVWQNKKANDINERLSLLEEEKYKLEMRPFAMISDWKANIEDVISVILSPTKIYYDIGKASNDHMNCACLSLFFTNTANYFITVSYSTATVYDNNDLVCKWPNRIANQQNSKLYLNSCKQGEIVFYAEKQTMESLVDKTIALELILENKLSERYKENINILVTSFDLHDDNSCFVHMLVQNYKIGKFIKDKDDKIVVKWEKN